MGTSRRRSDGKLESIDEIIGEILARGKVGGSARVAELWGQWKEIVGEDVAKHCFPEKLNSGKLYIKVDSPIWCQQLDMLKEELKEKIDDRLQNSGIKKIILKSVGSPDGLTT